MDPVELAFDLISTTAALAFKVSQLITELEIAGNEFEDIVYQLIITRAALSRLSSLFKNSSIPPHLTSDYAHQITEHHNILDGIETRLRRAQKILNSESFFSRFCLRHDLMDGDLRRLTNQILAFNTSLNLMATTYNCVISTFVSSTAARIGSGINKVESKIQAVEKMRMNINFHYIQAAMKIQQEDEYGCESSWETSTLPMYDDIQPTASTDTRMDMIEWDLPGRLSNTIEAQDGKAWNGSTTTNTTANGYPPILNSKVSC